jgi:membrane protease YdiL (CAAX protease family)
MTLGGLICAVTYVSFTYLFGHTISNAFVYISNSYATTGMQLTTETRMTYFIIFSLTGMTFSPIGEELFYRGVVHGSFVSRFGEQKASLIDSLAFAITHLAHFGIIYFSGKWEFLFLPSLLWIISMFFASRIFFLSKQKTGSIVGAILSHAGYNIAMMYFIFYHIF